jgi:hypothetical protein
MAKALDLSRMAVNRIWRAFGLQPHRSETFKLPTDPLLVENVRDIVRLYMNPPEHAAVFCVDENRRSKRWIAPNRSCRCGPARWSAARMTTIDTARPRGARRSTRRRVRSSRSFISAIARSSSASSSI